MCKPPAILFRHRCVGSWLSRHKGCDGVSNHQPHNSLLNRLFGRKSKETSKLRVTGLCAGNSPVTGEFPAQMVSNAEMFLFDDVIMCLNNKDGDNINDENVRYYEYLYPQCPLCRAVTCPLVNLQPSQIPTCCGRLITNGSVHTTQLFCVWIFDLYQHMVAWLTISLPLVQK